MEVFKTIRSKLLAAFLATSLASAAVAWMGMGGLGKMGELLTETTTNLAPSLVMLAKMDHAMLDILFQTRNAAMAVSDRLTGDYLAQSRYTAAKQKRLEDWAALGSLKVDWEAVPMKDNEKIQWAEFQTRLANFRQINDGIMVVLEAGDVSQAQQDMVNKGGPAAKSMMEPFQALVDIQNELVKRWIKEGDEALVSARQKMLGVSFIAIVAALVLGWFLTLAITRPLSRVTQVAAGIAKGDVHQTIDHRASDEVGQLAESFRELLEYINGLADAAKGLSRGDLSVKVVAKSEDDVLSQNFAATAGALNGLLGETRALISAAEQGDLSRRGDASRFQGAYAELVQGFNRVLEAMVVPVQEASSVLGEVADRNLTARMKGDYRGEYAKIKVSLNTAVQNLHDGLSSVASAVDQVAVASGQIASSSMAVAQGASEQARALGETSSSLGQMSNMTKANAGSAAQANELSASAKAASGQGSEAMAQMTEAMEKIRASAEGTAAIIRDINEIAFQTNLLALNAAVEAARAGEAGRGFAVVAEEVRNLALRSKEAAKKTESLISDSVNLAKHGEGVSKQVSQNLGEIVGAVTRVTGIINDIATSSAEQARGIDQVVKAVGQMDQVTQQNAASSEESSSSAEELAGQAREMTVLVGQFRLDRPDRASSSKGGAKHSQRRAPSLAAANPKRPSNGKHGHAAIPAALEDDSVFKDF